MAISENRLQLDLESERVRLADAQQQLTAKRIEVEKIKYRVEYIEGLLKNQKATTAQSGFFDAFGRTSEAAPPIASSPPKATTKPNGSTPDWIKTVLVHAGGEMRVPEIAQKIRDFHLVSPEFDFEKLVNNVWSVLHRATKNPRSPFVKKGRGTFDLRNRQSA